MAKRNSGGVAIFIKDNLSPFVTAINSKSTDIIWLKWETTFPLHSKQNMTLLLACIYVSPKSSSRIMPHQTLNILREEMVDFETRFPACNFLLLGDLNSRTGSLKDTLLVSESSHDLLYLNQTEINLFGNDKTIPARANCDKQTNDYGKCIIELCLEHDLIICNGRCGSDRNVGHFTCYTATGASVVDYCIVSSGLFEEISNFDILPITTYSIHAQLFLSLSLQVGHQTSEIANEPFGHTAFCSQQLQPRIKYIVPPEESAIFSRTFSERFEVDEYLNEANSNIAIQRFYDVIYDVADRYKYTYKPFKYNMGGSNEPSKNESPFFDHECHLKRKKIGQVQSTIKTLNIQNRKTNLYDNLIAENVKLLHLAKQDFKTTLKNKESEYLKKQTDEVSSALETDKGFWDYYKKKCPKQYNSLVEIPADRWVSHTEQLYSCPIYEVPDLGEPIQRENNSLDAPITNNEISDQLKKIKEKKACGPDGLGGGIIKSCFHTIFMFLCTFFNLIYASASYPLQWANSITFMLFKKGKKDDPGNYRSISLLNILSKVFAGVLHNRLMIWCEKESIFSDLQFGFRPNHSTVDSIFIHKTLIDAQLSRKQKKLFTCYIDFTKAFDTVIWDILWLKLAKIGISENSTFLKMLKSIYSSVTAQIITPLGLTPKINLRRGLRQGCILSPLLFILFINDIQDHFSKVNGHEMFINNISITHLLFADDLVIFSQSVIGLQRFLNTIEQYCKVFKLNINLSKTFIVVYRRGGKPAKSERWFLDQKPIKTVPHFKYLGVIFSTTGVWSKAQRDLANRARKAMFLIKKFVAITKIRNPTILFKIFDSCVMPILNYGSEVWGFHEGKDVDKVYHDFCKYVAGLPTNAPNLAARGEFGRKRLIFYRYNRVIKYWSKLLNNNCNKVLRAAYLEQLRLDAAGSDVWVSDVRTLLCMMGFSQIWSEPCIPNHKTFFSEFKSRLSCLEENLFDLQKHQFPRLFLFSQLKSLNISHHWSSDACFHLKALFSKFICSSHNLAIETGRRLKTPRNLRLCILCNGNVIEDEFHFLLICPLYNNIRHRYIPEHYRTEPSWNKVVSMLINPNYNKQVMYYLRSAFQIREKAIEAILYP